MQTTIDAIIKKKDEVNELQGKLGHLQHDIQHLESDLSAQFKTKWVLKILKGDESRAFLKTIGSIRISIKLENHEELKKLYKGLKQLGIDLTSSYSTKSYLSMPYFYYEGHIYPDGGGQVLLRDPAEKLMGLSSFNAKIPCTEEEWQDILDGDIPAKFLTTHTKGLLNIS